MDARGPQASIDLLNEIKSIDGEEVFVASGMNTIVIADKKHGDEYLECLAGTTYRVR